MPNGTLGEAGTAGLGQGQAGTPRLADLVYDTLTVVATTAKISATAVTDNIPLSVPVRAGYYFCPVTAKLVVYTLSGTAVGTLSVSYGNDANHSNSGIANFTAATINATVGLAPVELTLGAGASLMLDAAAPFFAKISSAQTGTVMTVKFLVIGAWLKTS